LVRRLHLREVLAEGPEEIERPSRLAVALLFTIASISNFNGTVCHFLVVAMGSSISAKGGSISWIFATVAALGLPVDPLLDRLSLHVLDEWEVLGKGTNGRPSRRIGVLSPPRYADASHLESTAGAALGAALAWSTAADRASPPLDIVARVLPIAGLWQAVTRLITPRGGVGRQPRASSTDL
jgi:hypothetical protein